MAGLNFGKSDYTASNRADGASCATSSWQSSTSMQCLNEVAPVATSTEITVGGLAGTRYPAFTFDGMPLRP